MRTFILLTGTFLAILAMGCDQQPATYAPDPNDDRFMEEVDRQNEIWQRQSEEVDRQQTEISRQNVEWARLLERQKLQTDRYDTLLDRWEEQADRKDAVLDRWEQQAGPGRESSPARLLGPGPFTRSTHRQTLCQSRGQN